jgi:DNA-binding response OmpR family regulator
VETVTEPLLLMVDDTPEIGLIVRRLGRRAGHEVVVCRDVPEAWEYLYRTQSDGLRTRRPPDLVVLDVNLPGTPGPELCRRLRLTSGLSDLPVAVFAHWDRAEDVVAGLMAGADFLVCKDVLTHPQAWTDRIGEVLARRRAALFLPDCPDSRPSADKVLAALNPVLRRALPRQAGPAVLPVLAERALRILSWWEETPAEGRRSPPRPQPLNAVPDGWLLPAGGLVPGRLAPLERPGTVLVFALALVDGIECLVGTAAAAPLWAALAAAVPALAETLARR